MSLFSGGDTHHGSVVQDSCIARQGMAEAVEMMEMAEMAGAEEDHQGCHRERQGSEGIQMIEAMGQS